MRQIIQAILTAVENVMQTAKYFNEDEPFGFLKEGLFD